MKHGQIEKGSGEERGSEREGEGAMRGRGRG